MSDFLDLRADDERAATLSDPFYRRALGLDKFVATRPPAGTTAGQQQQQQRRYQLTRLGAGN